MCLGCAHLAAGEVRTFSFEEFYEYFGIEFDLDAMAEEMTGWAEEQHRQRQERLQWRRNVNRIRFIVAVPLTLVSGVAFYWARKKYRNNS